MTPAEVEAWPDADRARFAEWLDDAASELQRIMLQRSAGAGHTPAEVHAFADAIRGLSDDALFSSCTVSERPPEGASVEQLLRAEGDPLYAFELNGGALDPAEMPARAAPPRVTTVPLSAAPDPRLLVYGQGRRRELSPVEPPPRTTRPSAPPRDAPPRGQLSHLLVDLLEASTRAGKTGWREVLLDVPSGWPLDEALRVAAEMLERNVPVPATVGPSPGVEVAFVVLMQRTVSANTRAWQLFAPRSNELVWVNESDLRARTELPFSDPSLRRLTRLIVDRP